MDKNQRISRLITASLLAQLSSEGKAVDSYSMSANMKLRPHYSDRSVNMMNSKERVQFSRELYQGHYTYPVNMSTVGYEKALDDLYSGKASFAEFQQEVAAAETQNTDWFDVLTQNSLSMQHTASISGGSNKSRYYASLGYNNENNVVKVNGNERYTFSMNIDNTFSKLLKASFTFNGYHTNRSYYQDEIAPLNYAYTTSRVIPVYNADGQYYYYNRERSNDYTYRYNILNELDNSYNRQKVNSMTFTSNLQFTFTDWLKANAILSVTYQDTDQEN